MAGEKYKIKTNTNTKSGLNHSAPNMGADGSDDEDIHNTYSGMSVGYNVNWARRGNKKKTPVNPFMSHAAFAVQAKGKEFRMLVTNKNYKEMSRFLEKDSTLANSASDLSGVTPLHIAASQGDIKAMDILLENNADVNVKDKKGNSAYSNLKAYIESQKKQLPVSQGDENNPIENKSNGDFDFNDLYENSTDENNPDENDDLMLMLNRLEITEAKLDNKSTDIKEDQDKRTSLTM